MFFRDYFNSISDCLDSKHKGFSRKNQNPADKGELCELFIKEFLEDIFSELYKIYRGGKIINCDNIESNQMDIVLANKNSLKIFGDKGIYPIETVYGVFSITSTLTHKKMESSVNELLSIPKYVMDLQLFNNSELFEMEAKEIFKKLIPYKCIFAFSGDIKYDWKESLNNYIKENIINDANLIYDMPNTIIVNKKGMLLKVLSESGIHSNQIEFDGYEYYNLTDNPYYGSFISILCNELFTLSSWQQCISPVYYRYFDKDLEEFYKHYGL